MLAPLRPRAPPSGPGPPGSHRRVRAARHPGPASPGSSPRCCRAARRSWPGGRGAPRQRRPPGRNSRGSRRRRPGRAALGNELVHVVQGAPDLERPDRGVVLVLHPELASRAGVEEGPGILRRRRHDGADLLPWIDSISDSVGSGRMVQAWAVIRCSSILVLGCFAAHGCRSSAGPPGSAAPSWQGITPILHGAAGAPQFVP